MYIGRIVAAGMTPNGNVTAAYRVSSRSFPNRTAQLRDETVAIMPRRGHESDLAKSPYIAYNALRLSGSIALATNGSQTDPIIEKIAMGMPVRDAMTLVLLAMDYEKDTLCTPRVCAAVDASKKIATLGIVRRDAVLVREFELAPGKIFYVSTYERNAPSKHNMDEGFDVEHADDICGYMISGGVFGGFEKPVTAASAVWNGKKYDLAVADAAV